MRRARVLLLGVASAALTLSAHAQPAAEPLVVRYAHGDFAALNSISAERASDLNAVRKDVKAASSLSLQVRAAFLTEAIDAAQHRPSSRMDPPGVIDEAIRGLFQDGCDIVRALPPDGAFARDWYLAAVAALAGGRAGVGTANFSAQGDRAGIFARDAARFDGHVDPGTIALGQALAIETLAWTGIFQSRADERVTATTSAEFSDRIESGRRTQTLRQEADAVRRALLALRKAQPFDPALRNLRTSEPRNPGTTRLLDHPSLEFRCTRPADEHVRPVAEPHPVAAATLGRDFANVRGLHERGSVQAHEAIGIEAAFEILERPADEVAARACVDARVVVFRFDPDDVVDRDRDHLAAVGDEQAIRTRTEIADHARQAVSGALRSLARSHPTETFGKAIRGIRLDEVVDRVEVERPDGVAVEGRREDDGRQALGPCGFAFEDGEDVRARHPDVEQGDIGPDLRKRARQLVARRTLRHHFDIRLRGRVSPREVARQRLVVRDEQPQGVTRHGAPRRPAG